MHHRGARCEVRAETHPVSVGDPHSGGHHVVDHPRELVHAEDRHRAPAAQPQAHLLETLDATRPVVGPHHIAQGAEHPIEVAAVRLDQAVRDQVQPQVGVAGVGRLIGERRHGADGHHLDVAVGIGAGQRGEFVGYVVGGQPGGARRAVGAELRRGEPGVQNRAVAGDGGQPEARSSSHGVPPY